MNLANTIIPKSDQLNADDLLAGPRTIKITSVESGSAEQPVSIHYEGENGRPYKPGKSMRRILVAIWGSDGAAYIGRSLMLYCDPTVKFGGDAVGGIRISHATDISGPHTMPLTQTRGKKKPFTVTPLMASSPANTRPLDELTVAGDSISLAGTDALSKWWKESLSGSERIVLKEKLSAWKEIAAKVGA